MVDSNDVSALPDRLLTLLSQLMLICMPTIPQALHDLADLDAEGWRHY
jgi:hypothetical protein